MIYLIITTSIYSKVGVQDDEHRKARYLECIQTALDFVKDDPEITPIVVENNGARPTYLDALPCAVEYTNNNALEFWHKGVNELLDVQEVMRRYNVQDDDTVIKLTGRYRLLNPFFFTIVKDDTHDAYVKFFNVCTLKFMHNDCVLGLVAIKAKYLKGFEYSGTQSPECDFAKLAHSTNRFLPLSSLELECCFADDLRLLAV